MLSFTMLYFVPANNPHALHGTTQLNHQESKQQTNTITARTRPQMFPST